MVSRAEISSKYAKAYARASKGDKGRVLDQVAEVTGWSRDNARRRLTAAAQQRPGPGRQVAQWPRKPRAPKYSYDAVKVLRFTQPALDNGALHSRGCSWGLKPPVSSRLLAM
ncbi:MAG: hypothetical protein ACRCYU_07085 [Nocardioides sp.]